jgi:hypothetical protein
MRGEIKDGLVRCVVVALLGACWLPSCGQSARNETTHAGAGGKPTGQGGGEAVSGTSDSAVGGTTQQAGAGRSSEGGRAGATMTSGGSKAVSGSPATDGGEAGAACACPLGDDCSPAEVVPCFEPCGGDPFGVWKLEDACFAGGVVETGQQGCQQQLRATPGESELTLRILDGGELDLHGSEDWTVGATETLACLGIESSSRCKDATAWPDVMLFSPSQEARCVANGCGACDCEDAAYGYIGGGFSQWSRAGNQLTLGGFTVDYCVKGDVLWLGGPTSEGVPRVSYKFQKHSCTGTPVPCADRSPKDCAKSSSCGVGHCVSKSGLDPKCAEITWEPDCAVAEGCQWAPEGCSGTTFETCDYDTCDLEFGCSWGEPKQRCGGYSSRCSDLDAVQCANQGCIVGPDSCVSPTKCGDLSVAECHSEPGCRLEW